MFAALARTGVLANTIVVVTGDHGEEFMEKGNWGHNSYFTEEQTRVPFVMYVPGTPPAVITRRTSHVDLVPTLAPLLGIANPSSDYSHGQSLFDPAPRAFVVFADWNRLGVRLVDLKFTLPVGDGSSYTRFPATTADDKPLSASSTAVAAQTSMLTRVLRDASRFQRAAIATE